MRLATQQFAGALDKTTEEALRRLVNPLCGIVQGLGFVRRGRRDPRVVVAGCELTGVHQILGQQEAGSYHIGGGGLTVDEALIRALAESLERYAQLTATLSLASELPLLTHREMVRMRRRTVDPECLELFTLEQLSGVDFPFAAFADDSPLAWVEMVDARDSSSLWVPAQLVFVGYIVQDERSERRIAAGVTTGTAAHTNPHTARRNALLELVQIDAAMGHWYTDRVAPKIEFDSTSARLESLIRRAFRGSSCVPSFYWLDAPGSDVPVVACVIERCDDVVPEIAVGLGVDFGAERAAYKALIEAVGVMQLAKVGLVNEAFAAWRGEGGAGADRHHEQQFLDLDSNVTMYARDGNSSSIKAKLGGTHSVSMRDLPSHPEVSDTRGIDRLLSALGRLGLRVAELDITTEEVAALGFVVSRAWSPDLLPLCLPGAPPLNHPGFKRYGVPNHVRPHPYP